METKLPENKPMPSPPIYTQLLSHKAEKNQHELDTQCPSQLFTAPSCLLKKGNVILCYCCPHQSKKNQKEKDLKIKMISEFRKPKNRAFCLSSFPSHLQVGD